jgi:glycosyltransferase involved in cell wall biosynthesis
MAELPKVSILIAFYNNIEHIEDSISSVYEQTYKNWELVVVDDCSPDDASKNKIETLQRHYGFRLIRHSKNRGASRAFQTAFEHSTGEYISILSHDDKYTPDKLEHSIDLILAHQLDAVYCNGIRIQSGKQERPFPIEEVLQKQQLGQEHVAELISSKDTVGCLLTQGALYARRIFEELKWVKSHFLLDDWPFTICVWRNYKVLFDPHPVYFYRLHDFNIHRQFWKWFPARVQVVSELVEDDQKLEVLAFLLGDLASASLRDGKRDDAYRLATAGLALAQNEENIANASKLIVKARPNKALARSYIAKAKSIINRSTLHFRIYRLLARKAVELVPSKASRKSIKQKLGI